jgi:Tol biopolymer transport system component
MLALSPDGRSVAFTADEQGNQDVWVYEMDRGTKRLTLDPAVDYEPTWSPLSDSIVFNSERNAISDLYITAADGSGQLRRLESGPYPDWAPNWSHGHILYHVALPPPNNRDIWYMAVPSAETPIPFLQTSANEGIPQLSPDGRYLAYQSDATGRDEVYVCSFPSGEGKMQISLKGGRHPRWNPSGNELFYIETGTWTLMLVSVTQQPTFSHDDPEPLFTEKQAGVMLESEWPYNPANYDVYPDGQHFVMIKGEIPPTMTIVQNWYAEFSDRK